MHSHIESNDNSIIKNHDLKFSEQDVKNTNEEYAGILQIRANPFGRGLFADRKYVRGDRIMSATAIEVKSERDSHSVQTQWDQHTIMDLPAVLINHCCEANTGICDNEKGAFDFFALCDIQHGEELLWDYETAEFVIDEFQCSCGSLKCRGRLGGFNLNGDDVVNRYGIEHIARYLQSNYRHRK